MIMTQVYCCFRWFKGGEMERGLFLTVKDLRFGFSYVCESRFGALVPSRRVILIRRK